MYKSIYRLDYAYEYMLDMILLEAWMDNNQLDVLLDKSKISYIVIHCSSEDATYIRDKLIEYEKRTK